MSSLAQIKVHNGFIEEAVQIFGQIHRTSAQGEPIFGKQLRCSGCHISGGPIMKELTEPHDSWWRTTRPLPLGARKPEKIASPNLKLKKALQTLFVTLGK
jgi:hypothetical protein